LVFGLTPAGPDQLWLAHFGMGLSLYDLDTEQVVATYAPDAGEPSSISDDRVVDIVAGQGGALWLITRSGVERFEPTTASFTHYPHGSGASGEMPQRVMALYEDQAGTLWIGGDGEGLVKLDADTGEVLASYRESQGLPNGVVYSILPDASGHLWVSTNNGLADFDPETETFRTYTPDDGLQSNEFNLGAAYRAADGELIFGGINGLNAFYPGSILENRVVPPVVITAVTLGPPGSTRAAARPQAPGHATSGVAIGIALPTDQPVALSYRDRILSFEFAALHYSIPSRNQYAYMLEGFDRDWYYVGTQRFATYTNLHPGHYMFRVKASNSDGIWNEEGASLPVTVTPPFWATGWFRGALGVVLVGAVFAAFRLRVRSVEARSRELEIQVGERTRELAAVNTIAEVVSRSLDLDAILSDALDKTLEVMGVEAGGIYLLDEARKVLWIAVQRGLDLEVVAGIDALEVGEGFSGRVAASGEPLVVSDLSQDDRLSRIAVRDAALRSLAVVPLRAKGRILGTLFAVSRDRRVFSSANVDLLIAIGHQIGVAVENTGLYTDTRSRLAQLSALQRTATAVASTLDQERLLGLIVQQATELLGARGGILNLTDWEAGEDRVVAATGSATSTLGMGSRLDRSLSGWSAVHRAPVLSNDLPADPRVDRAGLSLLEDEKGSPVESAAVVPLIVKDRVVGTLVLIDKQTGPRQFDQGDLDLLATFGNHAATAIENARHFEAEQRRAEQFRVMSEVGSRIVSILDVDELLKQIVALIQQAFGYYHVAIGLIEGDEVAYRVGAGSLWRDPQFGFVPSRLKVGREGIAGWVAATGEPLLVPDVSAEPRYVWMQQSDTRSELTVPLKAKGEVIGVLDIQSDRLNAFDDSDLLVLQALAYQAGVAIDNARLYEQARRLAIVEERQRLARELHDSVTQALYGVTLYAEASARQLTLGRLDVAVAHLTELRDTAQEALREMRLLIFELRPAVLASEGLVGALRARLEAVEERAGLGVTFSVDGEESLTIRAVPREVEEGLYWIAREALTNALKHAAARNVGVRLRFDDDSVVLEVVDDGVGFDTGAAAQSGGLGVDGMMERAARMSGTLVLASEPGQGTTVRVEVPR
jgi:signal transduction histidine kinase